MMTGQVLTGTPRYGSFTSGPDVINLGSLNSHLAIPIFSKPGRGMPFNYTLTFDNSVWYPSNVSGSSAWTPVFNWGWAAQTPVVTGELTYSSSSTKCYDQPPGFYWGTRYTHFVYYDPFGTVHQFNLTYTTCATDAGPHPVTAQDASGLTFDGYSKITTPKGQVFAPPINTGVATATVTDNNGNQISAGASGFTDTLGMTALSVAGSGTPC
jgi:hypothetical protein